MAIKKKVTYSVSYVAGTDTLTTKLNSLLQDIVTLILTQNSGLTVLDTITVGSSRWTGAPLYDTYVSGLYSYYFQNRHYESDVYFLGTNEDNVCLSIGFFDGELVIAMNVTPKVEAEYRDVWSSQYDHGDVLPLVIIGKASRWYEKNDTVAPINQSAAQGNLTNYSIPYYVLNNAISMSIIYWTGEYSRGYSFVNGATENDGIDLVIYQTDEGNNLTGLGAAIWPWGATTNHRGYQPGLLVFSFSEDVSNHKPTYLDKNYVGEWGHNPTTPEQVAINAKFDIRQWYNGTTDKFCMYGMYFCQLHILGDSQMCTDLDFFAWPTQKVIPWNVSTAYPPEQDTKPFTGNQDASVKGYISPRISAYNLPYLASNQAYIRKMRIPGWNPDCKGEIYLLWAPVLTAYQSGDIVEVGSKSYAIITEGAICWAARVS